MTKIWAILLKPRAWVAKILLIIGIVGFLVLSFLDYLHPIKAFLDSDYLSFKLGKNYFSVYLVIKTLITVLMIFWLTSILSAFCEKRIKTIKGINISNKAIITKILQILVYCFGCIIALDMLGIDVTTLAIFSGAIGIGIGLGLQKITANFISGMILLFEKSVKDGDLVELSDGTCGFIRHIGARYTLIETFEGKDVMIPNERFITERVMNWTFSSCKGRVEINIGVSYESDIEKAMELILEAAKEHPRCVDDIEPTCFLKEFADSSVNFLLFFWVADVTKGRLGAKSDVMRSIWKKFKEHHIGIPYPQRDIHIKKSDILA